MACNGADSSSTECLEVCFWGPVIINIFRAHVGDLTEPFTWSDSRAIDILTASAYQVSNEITCIQSPRINIFTGAFSSNPFLYPAFVNLLVLKAACLVDQGNLRQKIALEGVKATCGPAMLEVRGGGSSTYQLLFENGPCAAYKDLVDNLCFKSPLESATNCVQVVGTFVSDYYNSCNAC